MYMYFKYKEQNICISSIIIIKKLYIWTYCVNNLYILYISYIQCHQSNMGTLCCWNPCGWVLKRCLITALQLYQIQRFSFIRSKVLALSDQKFQRYQFKSFSFIRSKVLAFKDQKCYFIRSKVSVLSDSKCQSISWMRTHTNICPIVYEFRIMHPFLSKVGK